MNVDLVMTLLLFECVVEVDAASPCSIEIGRSVVVIIMRRRVLPVSWIVISSSAKIGQQVSAPPLLCPFR